MIAAILASRFTVPIVVAAVAVGVVFGAYRTGVNAERRAGVAAELRIQLATAKQTAERETRLRTEAEGLNRVLAEQLQQIDEARDALVADLGGGDAACRFTDPERMRILERFPLRR